ncbi:hypothetical protein MMC13_008080 [Lambiella insularis]|nr:hypothetical protein [Lambiella insularis]
MVNKSAIQSLAGIAEIILEVGAGPTVQHAVKHASFFSMLVQLSLLLWAHNVTSLADSLSKALELRAAGTEKTLPSYNHLTGTLRCIQQQTSGFLWELQFAAVDAMLTSKLRMNITNRGRIIPHVILRTLVDALPAVQRFPGSHLLAIQTGEGITTLVVWIHHVLGLSVEVQSDHDVFRFGQDSHCVSIDSRCQGEGGLPNVTLFNEVKDIFFRATVDPLDDPILSPESRHTLEGYGLTYLTYFRGDAKRSQAFVQRFIHSCLQIAEKERARQKLGPSSTSNERVPSDERILDVGRIIFPLYTISPNDIEPTSHTQPNQNAPDGSVASLAASDGLQPDSRFSYMPPKFEQELIHIVFALAMVNNLWECKHVLLKIHDKPISKYYPFGVNTARDAFETLAMLLLDPPPKKQDLDRASVVSCWGWSLCISSILCQDPGELHAELSIKKGVPARSKERKEWIMDHASGREWLHSLEHEDDLDYKAVARPGDHIVGLESFIEHSNAKYLVGTTDVAFQVYTVRTCSHSPDLTDYAYIRFGFRFMQELYWKVSGVPNCDHSVQKSEVFTLPDYCYVFKGLLDGLSLEKLDQQKAMKPDTLQVQPSLGEQSSNTDPQSLSRNALSYPTIWRAKIPASRTLPISSNSSNKEYRVHISQSTNNISLRWILLARVQKYLRDDEQRLFETCYLRGRNCCIDCALEYIEEQYKGRPRPLMTFNGASTLHVALIS